MTLQQIISQYNGKFWKVLPNTLPPQCFDLATGITDNLGVPHYPNNPSPFPYANAYQIYTDFGAWQAQYFDRIANSPTGVPQANDLVIWSNGYGSAGHVAVATGVGNTDIFQAFSQNDPFGSPCVLKTYNYNYVLGWLRCKIQPTQPVDDCPLKLTQVTQERDRLNDVIGLKDKELEALKNQVDTLSKQNLSLTTDLQAEKEHAKITLDAELSKQRTDMLITSEGEKKALQQEIDRLSKLPTKTIYKETPLEELYKGKSTKKKLQAITTIVLA